MKEFSELAGEFQRTRLGFVHTELNTGATFVEVARTQHNLGNARRAARNLTLAETACFEARRRLSECDPAQMRSVFKAARSKLEALETALAELRRF
jgi:hypothetical protein